MDKFIKTDTGGLPLRLDDFIWEQGELDASNYGIYQALQAQLNRYGTDYIVEGCSYSAPNLTSGWIMLGGELLRVDAQVGTDNYFSKVSTFDARGDKTFKDSSSQSTYQVNRGVLNAASGSLNITTAERLPDKIVQDIAANTTEQFAASNIPNLDASKINSGTFASARIPQATTTLLGGAELATQTEVNSGTSSTVIVAPSTLRGTTFETSQIPNLDANKITSGTFSTARIPNLDASKINSGTFASARIPQATESAVGGGEIATTAEAQAFISDTRLITPSKLGDVTGGIRQVYVSIGNWDMNSTNAILVAHGQTLNNIVGIRGIIRNDANNIKYGISPGGSTLGPYVSDIGSTNVDLRNTNSFFQSTDFDSASYNRGWLIIDILT